MKTPNNVKELREDLQRLYAELRNGEADNSTASVTQNTAGKVLAAAKVQLEYNRYTKRTNRIAFLEVDE